MAQDKLFTVEVEKDKPHCTRCNGMGFEYGAFSGWPHQCRCCNGTGTAQKER